MKIFGVCLSFLLLTFLVPASDVAAQSDAVMLFAVAWSPDGETLAFGGRAISGQGAVWLYDRRGVAIDTIYLPDHPVMIRWSHDGRRLAVRYQVQWGTQLSIWDWEAFNPDAPSVTTGDFRGPSEADQVVWSPTGRYIALEMQVAVHIIDAATGHEVAQLRDQTRTGTMGIVGIAWAADEQSLYVLYEAREANQLLKWDVTTARVTDTVLSGRSFSFPVSICQSADAQRLAISVATGSVFVLSAPDFQVERRLSVSQGDSHIPYVAYLYWLDDDSLLGVSYDGTSYLWNAATGDLLARDALISDRAIFLSDTDISPYGGRLALATRWRPTTPSATPAYDTYTTYQSLLEGMVRIAVPVPSLDRLNAIVELCAATTLPENLVTAVTLPEFIAEVEALPDGTIPPGCRADLLAMAHTLQAAE